jgi:hypothetical protein
MSVWQKENRYDKAVKVVLFLISPFFSFLYSLRTMNTRSSYVVFFLFAVFFGMSFSVGNIRTEGSIDGISYRAHFEEYKLKSSNYYYEGLNEFLTFDEGEKDYYFDTVAFYVSRITDNYHVMFMVFAIFFAFFSLKTFKLFITDNKFDISFASFILAYLFMANQIFNINGMRFWTAAWVGVYALFQIFGKKNKRYFLLLLVTPFFHGSFWIFIAVVVLAYLLMRFDKVWAVLFFISFFVGSIAVELLQETSDLLPAFMQRMIASYTDPEYIQSRSEGGTGFYWVQRLFSTLVRFYMNFMVYLFIRNSKTIKANPKSKSFYLFLLVYLTFVNFTMAVPSLGGRYMILAYPIIAYIWLVNFKGVKYKNYLYSMPIVFSFSIYGWIQRYLLVLDLEFFITSPFYLIYKYLIVI